MTSLVAEHRLWGAWASVVGSGGLSVAHGLSCFKACGICLDQESDLHPLHWQVGSYPLDCQESPGYVFLMAPLAVECCMDWRNQPVMSSGSGEG